MSLLTCPHCRTEGRHGVVNHKVTTKSGAVRRRRQCSGCGRRFNTFEELDPQVSSSAEGR